MEKVKQINIKNRNYYFYNDIIDLKHFDAKLLKFEKKSYKDTGIYHIDTLQLKKSMIVKICTVLILCIYYQSCKLIY